MKPVRHPARCPCTRGTAAALLAVALLILAQPAGADPVDPASGAPGPSSLPDPEDADRTLARLIEEAAQPDPLRRVERLTAARQEVLRRLQDGPPLRRSAIRGLRDAGQFDLAADALRQEMERTPGVLRETIYQWAVDSLRAERPWDSIERILLPVIREERPPARAELAGRLRAASSTALPDALREVLDARDLGPSDLGPALVHAELLQRLPRASDEEIAQRVRTALHERAEALLRHDVFDSPPPREDRVAAREHAILAARWWHAIGETQRERDAWRIALVASAPDEVASTLHLALHTLLEEDGLDLRTLEPLLAETPGSVSSWSRLLEEALTSGHLALALSAVDRLILLGGERADLLVIRARVHAAEGSTEQAHDAWLDAVLVASETELPELLRAALAAQGGPASPALELALGRRARLHGAARAASLEEVIRDDPRPPEGDGAPPAGASDGEPVRDVPARSLVALALSGPRSTQEATPDAVRMALNDLSPDARISLLRDAAMAGPEALRASGLMEVVPRRDRVSPETALWIALDVAEGADDCGDVVAFDAWRRWSADLPAAHTLLAESLARVGRYGCALAWLEGLPRVDGDGWVLGIRLAVTLDDEASLRRWFARRPPAVGEGPEIEGTRALLRAVQRPVEARRLGPSAPDGPGGAPDSELRRWRCGVSGLDERRLRWTGARGGIGRDGRAASALLRPEAGDRGEEAATPCVGDAEWAGVWGQVAAQVQRGEASRARAVAVEAAVLTPGEWRAWMAMAVAGSADGDVPGARWAASEALLRGAPRGVVAVCLAGGREPAACQPGGAGP
ncbi:MAG: hypothetical protein EA398_10905 [Deltaproteobacteria bacterium]|nr:MAG: hypothetical protein EA398_10905 [Deltaproteobacteria bacterium]